MSDEVTFIDRKGRSHTVYIDVDWQEASPGFTVRQIYVDGQPFEVDWPIGINIVAEIKLAYDRRLKD